MMAFEFGQEHDGNNPPAKIIRGTFFAEEGDYNLKIGRSSGGDFTETIQVSVPASGSCGVVLKILECANSNSTTLMTVKAIAFHKRKQDAAFTSGTIRIINYKCA